MALDSVPMDPELKLYDFVMARLRERRAPQKQVAAESGVPFSTLSKISQGVIKDPSVHHIQRLYDYFTRLDAGCSGCSCGNSQKSA